MLRVLHPRLKFIEPQLSVLLCYRPLQPAQYGVSSGWSGPAITFLSPSSVPGRLQRALAV